MADSLDHGLAVRQYAMIHFLALVPRHSGNESAMLFEDADLVPGQQAIRVCRTRQLVAAKKQLGR